MDEPTTATPGSATSRSADDEDLSGQEIRLAVVLNGGVSLAVWISGVTLELHRLAMAEQEEDKTYGPLLNLLRADAHIDVIAGTSAGGLNGAFLALGVSRGHDLRLLRDLWRDHGSLEKLLRNPLSKNPPSLLEGDDYFLPHVRDALAKIIEQPPLRSGRQHVDLILTGTLWQGRTTSFTDDLGAGITELDHDARFQFSLNNADRPGRDDDQLIKKLAAAARCTSSFPGAFEPHFVKVDKSAKKVLYGPDSMWDSGAGDANFARSQFVVDGGVLLNKPIRPALEAIYRQTAEAQVRRILVYVTPTADDPKLADQSEDDIPQAREVVLGVLTRLRATDSVSRELAEIRTHNAEARDRRRTRDRLAAAVIGVAEDLSAGAWPAYIEVRINYASRTIARLLAAGQNPTSPRWSERELVSAVQRLLWGWRMADEQFFIPRGNDVEQAVQRKDHEWDWGLTTVQRLGDIAVDVLKRAVWLAPLRSPSRKAIVNARKTLNTTLVEVRAGRRSLDNFWSSAPTREGKLIPTRGDAVENLDTPTEGTATGLMEWLNNVVAEWDKAPKSGEQDQVDVPTMTDRRKSHFEHALAIATCLHSCAVDIAVLTDEISAATDASSLEAQKSSDPRLLEGDRLKALCGYLLGPWESSDAPPGPQEVLERMLRLDVVQLAFAGASQEVEQEVELVQFAAKNRDRLTGVQLHHFGAFYRSSWRMNDWLHGRMDGATHVVRTLLSAERLRQRAAEIAPEDHEDDKVVAQLLEDVKRAALCTDNDIDRNWLEKCWDDDVKDCRASIESMVKTPQPIQIPRARDSDKDAGQAQPVEAAMTVSLDPPSREGDDLKSCVKVITRSIQTQILREDLSALADAIRNEGDDCAPSSQAWLASYDAIAHYRALQTTELWTLWETASAVGKERITAELGSDTLARTASQTAAVAANNVGAFTKPKVVNTVLGALRGYVLAVWAMVTFLTGVGNFGRRVVELSVAAGGVLLAVAILVPGMPLAFTLAGGLLLLAGVSAAALLTPEARGVGWRAAGCALLVLAVLVGDGYWELGRASGSSEAAGAKQQANAIWSVAVKVGIAFLVVFLGWWMARARPGKNIDWRKGRQAGRSAALCEVDRAVAIARDAGEKAGEEAGQRFGGSAGAMAGRENGARAGAAAGKRLARALRKVAARSGAAAGANAGGKAGALARASGDDWRTIWPDLKDFTEISEAAGHMAGMKAGDKAMRAAGDPKTVWEGAGRKAGREAGRKAGEKAGRKARNRAGGETRQSPDPETAREIGADQSG